MKEEELLLSQEQARLVGEFLVTLVDGKKCPHCKQPIQEKKQVGGCVYALLCGHRLYHGKLQHQKESENT